MEARKPPLGMAKTISLGDHPGRGNHGVKLDYGATVLKVKGKLLVTPVDGAVELVGVDEKVRLRIHVHDGKACLCPIEQPADWGYGQRLADRHYAFEPFLNLPWLKKMIGLQA